MKDPGNQWLTPFLIGISGLLVLFSFVAPYLFSGFKHFSDTGQIGDTIGGLMNPFVALAAVFTTFLAFWEQYKTNKKQWKALEENQKKQDLLQEDQEQREKERIDRERLDQFERQFVFMIDRHTSIVNNLSITGRDYAYRGIDFFERILHVLKEITETHQRSDKEFAIKLFKTILYGENADFNTDETFMANGREQTYRSEVEKGFNGYNYSFFNGFLNDLSSYYRNLYQMVDFVNTSCPTSELTGAEMARQYGKRIRTILCPGEQIFLYYYILSREDRGDYPRWINFLKEYKLIKNIPLNMIRGYDPVTWTRNDLGIEESEIYDFFEYFR